MPLTTVRVHVAWLSVLDDEPSEPMSALCTGPIAAEFQLGPRVKRGRYEHEEGVESGLMGARLPKTMSKNN